MRLILSETEVDAILFCHDALLSERCSITILTEAEKSHFAENLCASAFREQRKWEVHRAYKDFGKNHYIEFLNLNSSDKSFFQQLVAYLQIKYMIGGFTELIFPHILNQICLKIQGDIKFTPYTFQLPISNLNDLQVNILSRFKSIDLERYIVRSGR